MKNKNIAIALSSVLALIAAVGTTSPVFALSDSQRHSVGFIDGVHQALADYGVTSPSPYCPTRDDGSDHTSSYCDGYISGYRTQWTVTWKYHHPQQQSIDQNSNVNIKGNNNRVVVNQQASNSNGGNDGSNGHHDGSGINPRCAILCANIQIK